MTLQEIAKELKKVYKGNDDLKYMLKDLKNTSDSDDISYRTNELCSEKFN